MSGPRLKLAPDFSMPLDAITETFGILAARGAGKSNTAAAMAEEMFAAGLPFCVVDPVGSWWGLRSNAAGTGPGLPLAIFGGPKGDVPLERKGGSLIADIVVDERLSCVLDLRSFESEGAKRQFLLNFAQRLYRRNEQPLHLFLEEADDYIPQSTPRSEHGESAAVPGHLLRAFENIVRRGRSRGLGMTLITQRSAVLNKNVLTQVQTLIAMRTTGPQDRKAIEEWVKYNDQSKDILETLPSLADGEAWVWSPQFLKVTKRVQFRRRSTFDSGSTPKMAAKGKTATLADIDVSTLRARMADTIKRAEDDDPKKLKAEIARLQKLISSASNEAPKIDTELVGKLRDENRGLRASLKVANDAVTASDNRLRKIAALAQPSVLEGTLAAAPPPPVSVTLPRPAPRPAPPRPRTNGAAAPHDGSLGKGERAVLIAIAQHNEGVDREQITILTGYKRSTRDAYVQRLQAAGLVDVGPPITATDAGFAALPPDFEPLPKGDELREHWLQRLPAGERAVFAVLVEAYPSAVSRDEITERTSYKRSTRDAYIQRLGLRKLVNAEGGEVSASAFLFGQ